MTLPSTAWHDRRKIRTSRATQLLALATVLYLLCSIVRLDLSMRPGDRPDWNAQSTRYVDEVLSSRKLHIAAVCRIWPTHKPGGMQQHAQTLYSALAQAGHLVDVYTTTNPTMPSLMTDFGGNLRIHYLEGDGVQPGSQTSGWEKILRSEVLSRHSQLPFDLIHSESVGGRILHDTDIPFFATWHGYGYEGLRSAITIAQAQGNLNADAPAKRIDEARKHANREFDMAEVFQFQGYQYHIAISDQSYHDLIEVYRLPANRVTAIYNGVDTSRFHPSQDRRLQWRQQHHIAPNAIVLGCAGKITYEKGFSVIIDLLPTILQRHNVIIAVVGVGPVIAEFEKAANTHPRKVIVLAPQDQHAMASFYNGIDVLLAPTGYYQGLDLVMQEAMASGVAVLASHVGSIQQTLFPTPDVGLTFQVGDRIDFLEKLDFLVGNTREMHAIGRRAAERAQSLFSLPRMTQQYLQYFLSKLPISSSHHPSASPQH